MQIADTDLFCILSSRSTLLRYLAGWSCQQS